VVVASEAYKEAWLQGPSAIVALPAACLVNTSPYSGATVSLTPFASTLMIDVSASVTESPL
jgi:hypothetical protein